MSESISFHEAAIKILKESTKPLSAKEVYEQALSKGLIKKSKGKTPIQTMGAILDTDKSRFKKADKSKFIIKQQEPSKQKLPEKAAKS